MWDPQRLTTLWTSKIFYSSPVINREQNYHKDRPTCRILKRTRSVVHPMGLFYALQGEKHEDRCLSEFLSGQRQCVDIQQPPTGSKGESPSSHTKGVLPPVFCFPALILRVPLLRLMADRHRLGGGPINQ
jgi:hypothetical protein